MANVTGYVRVSTKNQVEDGQGLEVQEEQIRSWCDRHGHHLLAIHRDEGISGAKDSADRPGLARALTTLAGSSEWLVVAKLDRLARTLTVQEAILAQAWRLGGRVAASDVGEIAQDDPDDPMRTAMRQMMGVFAQLERAMITSRMRAGRRMKESKGGYVGRGSPRLGQVAVGGELVADPDEQRAIARIVELDGEGLSLRQIAARLDEDGFRPKRGGRWHPTVVRRVLARVEPAGDEGPVAA